MPLTYETPPMETPKDNNGYFEQMTKAIFQAGFNWSIIRNKWENFQKAFDNFDINKVADYCPDDIQRLVCDKGIVRNRQKIGATIENANLLKQIIEEHGSFKKYLDSLPSDYYERVSILTKQFKHLGRTGAFVFLYCVNEPVPEWQDR